MRGGYRDPGGGAKSGGGKFTQYAIPFGAADGKLTEAATKLLFDTSTDQLKLLNGARLVVPASTIIGTADTGIRINGSGQIEVVIGGAVKAVFDTTQGQVLSLGATAGAGTNDLYARVLRNASGDTISPGGSGFFEVVAGAGRDLYMAYTTPGKAIITPIHGTAKLTSVQTTNDTVTTAGTHTPQNGSVNNIRCTVTAYRTDGSEAAVYTLIAGVRKISSTANLIGAVTVVSALEDVAGWDATIDVSGGDVRVRVTGEAAKTINWDVQWTAFSEN